MCGCITWPRPDDDLEGVRSRWWCLKGKDLGTVVGDDCACRRGEYKALGISTVARGRMGDRSGVVVLLGAKAMGVWVVISIRGDGTEVRFAWVQAAKDLPDNVLGLGRGGCDRVAGGCDQAVGHCAGFSVEGVAGMGACGGAFDYFGEPAGEEFLKADERLRAAMPISLTRHAGVEV